jgi:hypothetical protein
MSAFGAGIENRLPFFVAEILWGIRALNELVLDDRLLNLEIL